MKKSSKRNSSEIGFKDQIIVKGKSLKTQYLQPFIAKD